MLAGYEKATIANVYISFKPIAEIPVFFYKHYLLSSILDNQLAQRINSTARMDDL